MNTRILRFSLLAALAIAMLAVLACGSEDYPANLDSASNGGDDYAGVPAPGAADRDESVSTVPGGTGDGGSGVSSTLDRKIVRTATITLEVEDVTASVRGIEDAAIASGGFVSGSSISTGDDEDEPQNGTITIRVPAESYAAVLDDLRGLATRVRSESSQTSEVTEEYTDLESRLRNLEATEARYIDLLGQATTIDEILTVQDRLNGVRLEIEQVTGRINALDNLTELATINVSLFLPAAGTVRPSQHWAARAWEMSWDASKDVAVVLASGAIALGVLALWIVPLLLGGVLCWRLFGRRLAAIFAQTDPGSTAPPAGSQGAG